MKKIYTILTLVLVFILSSCNSIKEYKGVKINKITYISIDYNGGYTIKHELDFNENKYSNVGYLPPEDNNPILENKSTFTDEEEKIFMDKCYTYGLFSIKEKYSSPPGIIDGGGWNLIIEYADDTVKESRGSNNAPKAFKKCVTTFYDLCGDGVVGYVPYYYITPPHIDVSYQYFYENTRYSISFNTVIANYKWNNSESQNNNLYLLNEDIKSVNLFDSNVNYKLILHTRNYECDEKYNKIVVKEYDYNSELSNEKIIYESIFKNKNTMQVELDIKVNKIYVYELIYKDGDYVQYTFNTCC